MNSLISEEFDKKFPLSYVYKLRFTYWEKTGRVDC